MDLFNELKKESSFKDLSEEQALAQIKTLANEAAKVPALEAKISTLETSQQAAKDAATTAYLNQAVSEGKISAEQVDTYKALMKADEASTRKLIDAMPKNQAKQVSITDLLKGKGGAGASAGAKQDLAQMSWDEIDKAERLAELKNEHPDLYAVKYREKFGA